MQANNVACHQYNGATEPHMIFIAQRKRASLTNMRA